MTGVSVEHSWEPVLQVELMIWNCSWMSVQMCVYIYIWVHGPLNRRTWGKKSIFKPPRKRITLFTLNTYLHYNLRSLPILNYSFSVVLHFWQMYIIAIRILFTVGLGKKTGWRVWLQAGGVTWSVTEWLQHDTKLAVFLLHFPNQTNPHRPTWQIFFRFLLLLFFLWFLFISSHQRHDYFITLCAIFGGKHCFRLEYFTSKLQRQNK